MITILIYGLDQFVTGRLSRELLPGLSELYETEEEEIDFIAPESMTFHNGVEQTSWNIYVKVRASYKYELLQDVVAKYLLSELSTYSININLEFEYFDDRNTYQRINQEYPRFITEENMVSVDNGVHAPKYDELDDEADDESDEDDEEVYTGDIFEGLKDE